MGAVIARLDDVVMDEVHLTTPVSDEAISRLNASLRLVKVWRTDSRAVRMHMPLVLEGGVTAAWLGRSLQHWFRSWRECERQLRSTAVPTKRHRTSQPAALVH